MAVNQSEHGTATVSSNRVVKGNSVKFSATADAGYTFEKWVDEKGNKVADQNPYVIATTTKSLKLTPVYIAMPAATSKIDFESPYYFDKTGGYSGGAVWYTPTYADVGGYDSKNVHGGNGSLVYKVSQTNWDAYTSGVVMKKDTTYKVSFWFKSTSSTGMVAYYGLSKLISQDSQRKYLSVSTGWQKVTAYYTPSEDDVFRMKFYSGNDGGLAENTLHFFDDFCVEEFSTPKTQEVKFDEEIPTTNFFSWNTNTKFTRNGSKGSLKFDGVNSQGALNDKWDPSSGKHAIYNVGGVILDSNTQYTVSFWYYNPNSTSGELQLNFTGNYIGFVGASLKQAAAGWKQCSITFQTSNSTNSTMFFVGRPGMIFYIDDLVVQMNDKVGSYCEPLFNLINNGDIEEEISEDNFKNLPSWITRNNNRNENASANGGYYLTVDAAKSKGEKYVLPISIPKSGKYVFGVSMKAISANNVKVYLVDDIDLMSINKLMSDYNNNFVCTPENANNYERLSFRMSFNTAKTVYLVIEGNSGKVNIDAIQLFQLKYTKEKDQGDYRIIEAYNFDAEGVSPDSDTVSPITGDNSKFIISFIIFITSLIVLCASLLIKKAVPTNEYNKDI